ncbi:hypothetical protein ACEXQE_05575 [Herbiconiux sp. P17]|uniref:hypothetical protein n=1 Tax=Herbiconiux wuyangfengii TaxID=3342794 RepID=UPI0035B97894
MPRRVPVPQELLARPFSVVEGRAAGLGSERLRGPDLARPFHGTRVEASTPVSLFGLCDAYARRAPESHFFSHVTAALLWRVPLPRRVRSQAELDVAVQKPDALPRANRVRGHRLGDAGLRVIERKGLRVPIRHPCGVSSARSSATPISSLPLIISFSDLATPTETDDRS